MVDLTEVLQRLVELGPPSEIRARAPGEAARALDVDRVVLSSIRRGELVVDALHVPAGEDALRERPVALEYPLIEGEIMRRRRAQVVRGAEHSAFGWSEYVAAPVVLDGRVIGFLHADREPSARAVGEEDAEALAGFALCFALVYERALLRHRLRGQREEMRQVAAWAAARTSELGDRSITLAGDEEPEEAPRANGDHGLRDLLTRRELDVLELLVKGETNAGIARELVVAPGTVKFHVKNILRKLHASNRAEATSRYLRMTLRGPAGR